MRSLIALLALALPALAQQRGLLDSLNDGFDPSKDRRGDQAAPRDPSEPPAADEPAPAAPVKPAPDPERLEERLEHMKGVGYDDVEPVQGPRQVEERLERLRRRAERQRLRADEQTRKTVAGLEERAKKLREKWQPMMDALADGTQRSVEEWVALLDAARGLPTEPEPAPAPPAPSEDADELLGLEEEEAQPEAKPPPEPVEPPDLSDLKKAIEAHEKPAGMHPLTWLALQEEFERDLRELRIAAAVARKKLADQRRRDLAPVLEALRSAERTFENLKKLGGTPPEWMRRQLAWRLHQADLEQLRLAVADQKALAKERGGDPSGRPPVIEMYPLDPARTINQIARLIETSGEPEAPRPDAFDSLDGDGLPPLYPKGSETVLDDKSVHYGNLVKANIDRYHRRLDELKRQLANAARRIEREDKRAMRRYAADLYRADKLAGQLYVQPARDRRRAALEKKWAESKATRATRIEQERARLQAMVDSVTARLEAEYRRRDAMLEKGAPRGGEDD